MSKIQTAKMNCFDVMERNITKPFSSWAKLCGTSITNRMINKLGSENLYSNYKLMWLFLFVLFLVIKLNNDVHVYSCDLVFFFLDYPGDGGDDKFVLKGQRARSKTDHQKSQPSAREMAINYAQKVCKPTQQAKSRVRNYNIRDDNNGTRWHTHTYLKPWLYKLLS